MQNLVRSKTIGVTGNGERGTAGAGPGGDLLRCVVLCVPCPGPLGSCSPVCGLGVLCGVCGVLGHLPPVQRCAGSVCCVACAVSWPTWLLFSGFLARCVVLHVRCPRPLGSCSLMPLLCVLGCVSGVWASWHPFSGVLAPPVVSCLRCPGRLGSCSPVCTVGVLCCMCGVLGLLAPVCRCARSVYCVVCAVSWATWLLFTFAHARCVVLCLQCPWPLSFCSPVGMFSVLCSVCGFLGLLAPVHRCACSVRFVLCGVSWALWLMFSDTHARCVVFPAWCVPCVIILATWCVLSSMYVCCVVCPRPLVSGWWFWCGCGVCVSWWCFAPGVWVCSLLVPCPPLCKNSSCRSTRPRLLCATSGTHALFSGGWS